MDRLHAMTVFARVAEAGGFAEAARRLNMSPPAVTRAVAALEDALGTRLLARTTRTVKLTETGERYLDDCRRILAELDQAEAAASGSYRAPIGVLTLSAPVLFGRMHVLPILTEFLDQHPKVVGRAMFVDRMTSLVEEGIDVAVRIGHLADASYAATRVGAVRRIVCAAPDYLERHGAPQSPIDLSRHRLIAPTSAWSAHEWRFGQEGDLVVRVEATLSCSTNDAAIAAAVAGFGLTRVASYQVEAELKAGTLKTVLEDFEEAPLPVHVAHPERRHAPAKVRAFTDLAVERLRANPAIRD